MEKLQAFEQFLSLVKKVYYDDVRTLVVTLQPPIRTLHLSHGQHQQYNNKKP